MNARILPFERPRPIDGVPPPHSLEAESTCLCAAMVDPDTFRRVSAILRPTHFYSRAHSRVFEAAMGLGEAGQPIDAVTIASWLRERGWLQELPQGISFLVELLADGQASIPRAVEHARIVFDFWRMRRALVVCHDAVARGYNDYGDTQAYLRKLQADIGELADSGKAYQVKSNLDALCIVVKELSSRAGHSGVTGIATGLARYDETTCGLHAGEYTCIGARPGVGKTALLCHMAANIAAAGFGVGFVSLEMNQKELLTRITCNRARVDGSRIRAATLSQSEMQRFMGASQEVAKMPVWIDDRQGRTVEDVRESAFMFLDMAARQGVPLGVIFVDYVQYIQPSEELRNKPLKDALAYASKRLKAMAREFKVPVVAAVALNRDIEKRSGKARFPKKSDVRDCGNIESDADTLVFLHRESLVDEHDRERFAEDGKGWLIVDKQRHGGSATLPIGLDLASSRFFERTPGYGDN